MVNFLKNNPHKFDANICGGFLEKIGVDLEFKEIVDFYMADWQTKVDMTSVNTFVSDTNVIDISNRSLLKSMDRSSRRIQVKRASDVSTLLKCLDEVPPQPSRHPKDKKREFHSCPRFQRLVAIDWSLVPLEKRSKSQGMKKQVKKPLISSRLAAPVKPIELLYINEVTQALSFQSLIFKSNFK